MELTELKKQLKPMGFTIQIRSYSHGRHGIIKHIATKKLMTQNVFTEESLQFWKPAIELIKQQPFITQDSDKIYGLKF